MCMKIFTWNIDLNGYVENKNTIRCPFSSCMYLKSCEVLVIYTMEKNYKTNIGLPLDR